MSSVTVSVYHLSILSHRFDVQWGVMGNTGDAIQRTGYEPRNNACIMHTLEPCIKGIYCSLILVQINFHKQRVTNRTKTTDVMQATKPAAYPPCLYSCISFIVVG